MEELLMGNSMRLTNWTNVAEVGAHNKTAHRETEKKVKLEKIYIIFIN